MIFTSGLGILLSLIFGCLLLGIIAELYYLLWWKKQSKSHNASSSDSSTNSSSSRNEVEYYIKHAKQHLYLFCWNKPSTHHHQKFTAHHESTKTEDADLESGKDFLFKPSFGGVGEEEEGVESELMRLHNLSGPPRFLFTIKEETKEDLESEDGRYSRSRKGSRTRSLSDLIMSAESPLILSPLASPPMKAAADGGSYNNTGGFVECRYSHHGFNPLFESSNVLEAELNRLRCSPPPKLKFLRDAEEKLYRRLLEEAERMEDSIKKVDHSCGGGGAEEVDCRDGSFIRIIVGKNRERELQHHNHNNQHHVLVHSTSSQVLPLASSPPTSSAPLFESKH